MLLKFFNLIKFEHTIFSLPIMFAGAYLGAGRQLPDLDKLTLIILAGVGARTFGMAMNRILDRKIDANNTRTQSRELPSGQLTLHHAIFVVFVGLFLYLLSCYWLDPFILKLSIIPLSILSTYSLLKRFTWLCHYGIGLALGLSPLGAFVAITNGLNFTPEILLLSGFTFFWMSGYDIIYALQDIDFDKEYKIYSIPGRFNAQQAQIIAGITHLISFCLLFWLTLQLTPSFLNSLTLIACGLTFLSSYSPSIPLSKRFFPSAAVAGIFGAIIVFL